jgi:hypothetical protein
MASIAGRDPDGFKRYFTEGGVLSSNYRTATYIVVFRCSLELLLTYKKRVVVVGASVSAADIAVDLIGIARGPVYAVIKGHKANGYFGDVAFQHPSIEPKPSISHIDSSKGKRTVHFIDGTSIDDVDELIFGTGYSWSLPFLPQVEVRNNRVPGLYLHVVYQKDPTLLFVGAVSLLHPA